MKKILLIVAMLFVTSAFASDGATLFKKCSVCHGQLAEKKALGKSRVIATWDAQKIADALHGYKDGTYGGIMKSTMQGQVKNLNDDDIQVVAKYIDSLM